MDLSNPPAPHGHGHGLLPLSRAEHAVLPRFGKGMEALLRRVAASLSCRYSAIYFRQNDGHWVAESSHFKDHQSAAADCLGEAVRSSMQPVAIDISQPTEEYRDQIAAMKELGMRRFLGVPIIEDQTSCDGVICVFDFHQSDGWLAKINYVPLEEFAEIASELIAAGKAKRHAMIAGKVVQATSEAVLAADQEGRIVFWNPAAAKLFGYSEAEAVGEDISIIIPHKFHTAHGHGYKRAAQSGNARYIGSVGEFTGRCADGQEIPIEISLAKWGDLETEGGFAALIRDISDRKALERDRLQARKFLDDVVANLPTMIFVKDLKSKRYVLVNRMAEKTVGLRAEDMVGQTDLELFPDVGREFQQRDSAAVGCSRPTVFESDFKRADGTKVNLRTTRVVIDGPDGDEQYVLGVSENRTEIRRAEAENYRLVRFDSLTGLLNRVSFSERIHSLVTRQTPFALVSFDLDRFKSINDQFGHMAGDRVLKEVATRIAKTDVNIDLLARVGGDEFVVLLSGDQLRERAEKFSRSVLLSLGEPVKMRGKVAYLGASIGVTLFPDDATTVQGLRENADLALYRAKNNGRGQICYFDSEMDEAVRNRKKLESDLRDAVEKQKIVLHYQPIICCQTGGVSSVEALARWEHEKYGWVKSAEFITLAEECGLIERLGAHLLMRACKDAAGWRNSLKVSVNLSPIQFRSGNLIKDVKKALEISSLEPERLMLEVTERLVIEDPDATFEQLAKLRSLGIQVLMDDFGVGYSSLSYFNKFPFDKVKVDKSFVDQLESTPAAKAIVKAVVDIGQELSMGVVAEGVETAAQADMLASLGCTHLQGYLYSSAVEPDAVELLNDRLTESLARSK